MWFLTVWWDMTCYTEVQTSLKKAHEALTNLIAEDPAVRMKFTTVQSVFRDLKWDEQFEHGGVKISAHEFAPLLRKVMLEKNITQGMIAHLQDRLHRDSNAEKAHYICGSEFSQFITTAEERGRIKRSEKDPQKMKARCLQDIGEAVKRNPKLQVWIPVLREQHEVAIRVDFNSKTIAYGKLGIKPSVLKLIVIHR